MKESQMRSKKQSQHVQVLKSPDQFDESKNKRVRIQHSYSQKNFQTDFSLGQSISHNTSQSNIRYQRMIKDINRINTELSQSNHQGSTFIGTNSIQSVIQKVTNYLDLVCTEDSVMEAMGLLITYIQNLEGKLRIMTKEVSEQQNINSYYLASKNQQEQMFQQIIKENIELKNFQQKTFINQNNQNQKQTKLNNDKNALMPYSLIRLPALNKTAQNEKNFQLVKKTFNIKIQSPREKKKDPNLHLSQNNSNHNLLGQRLETENLTEADFAQNNQPTNSASYNNLNENNNPGQMEQTNFVQKSTLEPDSPQRINKLNQKKKSLSIYIGENFLEKHILHQAQTQGAFIFNKADFQMHINEFSFYKELLQFSQSSDQELIQAVNNNEQMNFLFNLIQDHHKFRQYLSQIDKQQFFFLYETILQSYTRQQSFLGLSLKLKNLILSIGRINQSITVTEAFQNIIKETCKILNCDRASVFLIDKKRNLLWTKLAKGSKPIQVDVGKGIVGYVAKFKETVNILDAHGDARFDSKADIANHYRTRTVLCVPIWMNNNQAQQNNQNQNNKSNETNNNNSNTPQLNTQQSMGPINFPVSEVKGELIGVLQAINKINGFFTKDDEGIINLIAQIAQPVLVNSQGIGEKILQENSQRALLKLIQNLIKCRSDEQLIKVAQKRICSLFDLQKSRVFLVKDKKLVFYNQEQQKIEEQEIIGIVQNVVESQRMVSVSSCYSDFRFNSQVDIDTNLPVVTMPIIYQDKNLVLGAIQVINPKGIENLLFEDGNLTISHVLQQILDTTSQILARLIINLNKLNEGTEVIYSDDDFI